MWGLIWGTCDHIEYTAVLVDQPSSIIFNFIRSWLTDFNLWSLSDQLYGPCRPTCYMVLVRPPEFYGPCRPTLLYGPCRPTLYGPC